MTETYQTVHQRLLAQVQKSKSMFTLWERLTVFGKETSAVVHDTEDSGRQRITIPLPRGNLVLNKVGERVTISSASGMDMSNHVLRTLARPKGTVLPLTVDHKQLIRVLTTTIT